MILVFIFLGLLIINFVIFLILIMSSLHIKIDNLKVKDMKIEKDYKIFIQLYFFDKIKYLSILVDNKKIKKISLNQKFKNFNNIKKPKANELFNALNKLNLKIDKLNLNAKIGIKDACLLAYVVVIISSIISIILPHFAKNKKQINYKIEPVYNKNLFNLFLEGIINIKIVNIIYVIYILAKKGSNNNERTSNRRTYAYSYE